jgi:hypothetical protein
VENKEYGKEKENKTEGEKRLWCLKSILTSVKLLFGERNISSSRMFSRPFKPDLDMAGSLMIRLLAMNGNVQCQAQKAMFRSRSAPLSNNSAMTIKSFTTFPRH